MTNSCLSAEVVARSRRSLPCRTPSRLKTWVARAVWCWARIELKIQAVSVHELQAGEPAQVQNVETAAQGEFLRAAGCNVLQGYLISRPCDAGAFEAWALLYCEP